MASAEITMATEGGVAEAVVVVVAVDQEMIEETIDVV